MEKGNAGAPLWELASTSVVYVREDMWADAVMDLFVANDIDEAPVIDDGGHPVGTVCKADLIDAVVSVGEDDDDDQVPEVSDDGVPLFALSADGFTYPLGKGFHLAGDRLGADSRCVVAQVMRPACSVLREDMPVAEAVAVTRPDNVRQIVVVDQDGVLVGVVRASDLNDSDNPSVRRAAWTLHNRRPHHRSPSVERSVRG